MMLLCTEAKISQCDIIFIGLGHAHVAAAHSRIEVHDSHTKILHAGKKLR
jgi:hypothetical protein